MSSISSVITGGFGIPGSAALVITDGYGVGAAVATTLVGRRRRRRRIWNSEIAQVEVPTAAAVAAERKMVAEMLLQAELDQLIDETKILRAALDQAAKRQSKAINGMLKAIDKRVVEITEDDDLTTLLLQD